ncbi:MAG: hypothetical protein IKZ94_08885 [Lachnospiraceae bacterium]|nr:hypothetical protein [Lachnospiraceae bacterium]
MAKVGRKNRYETHVKPFFKEIEQWCNTMTERQIAEKLGIAYSTWNQYKVDYLELTELLKKGRRDLVTELRSALIRKAKGYEYTETKTISEAVNWPEDLYVLLRESGFTDEQIERSRLVRTEVSKKHMAPDVAALNLALKNYDKDNWANDPQMMKIREKELELRERQIENNEW